MKKWIALLMCTMILGIGFASLAQEISGEGTASDSGGVASALGGSSWSSMLILFAVFGAIFYFMLIRPQQRRQKERNAMLEQVKSGAKVVFSGGILGIITNVKEKTFVIKIADNVKIEVSRGAVTQVLEKGDELEEEKSS